MQPVRIKRAIQILAGIAAVVLALVYVITRPTKSGDLYLAWGLFAVGVGLIAEVLDNV